MPGDRGQERPSLITLPPERVAAERRHAREQGVLDAAWRRKTRRLFFRCFVVYAAGTALAFSSLGVTGDLAQMALWGGFAVGNGAILVFLLAMWSRESE